MPPLLVVFLYSLFIISMVAACIGLVFYLFYPAILARNNNKDQQSKVTSVITLQEPTTTNVPPLLTLVIPAYNEQDRLPNMLEQAYEYLSSSDTASTSSSPSSLPLALQTLLEHRREQQQDISNKESPLGITVEWILVNDGSTDATNAAYRTFLEQKQHTTNTNTMCWKLISFPQNRGKGAAVQAGMLAATGDTCLMVDADGATSFGPGLEALVHHYYTHPSTTLVWGSRARDTADRSLVRWIFTTVFQTCVTVLVASSRIRDTQCGFKLFPRAAARELFANLHLNGWAFDTELLYLASSNCYTIQEVVVPWREVEGSKLHTSALNLVLVSIGMLRDMICVRLCYTFGVWKIRRKED